MSLILKDTLIKITKIEKACDGLPFRNIEEGHWTIGVTEFDVEVGKSLNMTNWSNNRDPYWSGFSTSAVTSVEMVPLGFLMCTKNSKYFVDVLNRDVFTREFVAKMPTHIGEPNPFLASLKAAVLGVNLHDLPLPENV